MKLKHLLMGMAGVSLGLLAACDNNNSGAPPPATSTPQNLDTTQVLAQAQKPSETASPYTVDNGALTLTDTSETTSPVAVNTTP